MDELNAVRDLLAVPEPAPEVEAEGRVRLLAALAVQDQDVGRRRTRSRWWAPVRNGLIGATAAAALALAVAVPSDSLRISPDPVESRPTARQILLAAAGAMAKAPSDGAYWRTDLVAGQLFLSPDRGYVIRRESARDIWLTKQGGGQDRWSGQYLGAKPATPLDEAAWRAAGSPVGWRYPADVTGLGRVSPQALVEAAPGPPRNGPHRVGWRDADGILTKHLVTWKSLREIPSDATRLRAYLVASVVKEDGAYIGREMEESELRKACLEVISELPVPPEVRSSAYQILASIPGMRAEGQVTDPLGRVGQALSYQVVKDGRPTDERLVINPANGLPLAAETSTAIRLADGRDVEVGSYLAYQAIGWTDQQPTGAP